MATQRQVQEMVAYLASRTHFGASANGKQYRLPSASIFAPVLADFKVIQPYSAHDFNEKKKLIKVLHIELGCMRQVHFRPDSKDHIMSRYRCDCGDFWELRYLPAVKSEALAAQFSTLMVEDDDDWPEKLDWVTNKTVRYETVRPLSPAELLESRAKRILAIRESAP